MIGIGGKGFAYFPPISLTFNIKALETMVETFIKEIPFIVKNAQMRATDIISVAVIRGIGIVNAYNATGGKNSKLLPFISIAAASIVSGVSTDKVLRSEATEYYRANIGKFWEWYGENVKYNVSPYGACSTRINVSEFLCYNDTIKCVMSNFAHFEDFPHSLKFSTFKGTCELKSMVDLVNDFLSMWNMIGEKGKIVIQNMEGIIGMLSYPDKKRMAKIMRSFKETPTIEEGKLNETIDGLIYGENDGYALAECNQRLGSSWGDEKMLIERSRVTSVANGSLSVMMPHGVVSSDGKLSFKQASFTYDKLMDTWREQDAKMHEILEGVKKMRERFNAAD